MTVISKDLFIESIEEVKKCEEYQDWLNKQLQSHGADGYVFQPTCVDTTIKLLHNIFGEADSSDMISYFCFELGFGKKWKEGMVLDSNNNDIKLSTSEDLYNYLISQCN